MQTATTITYQNRIFELGHRDAHRLALYLECSPPVEDVIDFVKHNYGPSCEIKNADENSFIKVTVKQTTNLQKARKVEWIEKPAPKKFEWKPLPALSTEKMEIE